MSTVRRLESSRARLSFLNRAGEAVSELRGAGRALFILFAGMLVVSTLALLFMLESSIVVPSPSRGGTLTEGIVGTPRFINPVLAISDADRDLTALIYSGLLRATPEGEYVPDLAQEYSVSDDGLIYTALLREGIVFHDGTPVTAEDIVFTVRKAQAAAIKSPLRANWDSVTVEAPDARTVRFTLPAPYAPFIENLTLGILPAHLWEGVAEEEFPFSELNTDPVGSGPYKVESIARSQGGIPSVYTLRANDSYALGEPYLSRLRLNFYQNEAALAKALKDKEVESGSGLSQAGVEGLKEAPKTTSLNRVFGVFFNQNQSEVLRNKTVREALSLAIDRQLLVEEVLGGFGTPLVGPVPPSLLHTPVPTRTEDPVAQAQQMLLDAGWRLEGTTLVRGEDDEVEQLSFSLSTGNVPELRRAAEYVRDVWGRMGAQVEVHIYEAGDLSQNVIRPRKYDALLFGEVIGRELDLYAFWHSSQRNDPGLNIALYANVTADAALETMRQTQDDARRLELYQEFLGEIEADIPAVFLYAPDFVYSVPNDLNGITLGLVETPSDRFLSITQWHREVDYVWPVFASGRAR